MTVENLEIKVTTDADKAAEQFNSLSKALEGIQSSAVDVGKASKKVKSSLDDALRERIRDADRLEIATHKVTDATRRMNKAFMQGDENAAWRAREQQMNAEETVAKLTPKNPLSTKTQEMIETATQIDVLKEKALALEDALNEAFGNGDRDKAYELRGKIIRVNEQIERLENAAKKAAEAEKQTANATEKVANAAKKANKPLGNFISSLKRIAFYRIIRGIIKGITQAMKEGLEWSYNFAKSLPDAVDSSGRFAAALDRMTTASSMLKAQLGSAFISLLSALEPILTKLIDLALKAADAISQFFAAFTGTTYIKATGGLVKAFQSGAKAAKEWKNQLLGFDEINRLNEPSNGGGGGANPLSNILGTDTPLDDWAMKLREKITWIENHMGTIKTIAEGVGIALLAWKFGGFLTGLTNVAASLSTMLGLALAIGGAFVFVKGATDAWVKGVNWDNLTLMFVGLSTVVVGLSLAFGAVAGAVAALVGGVAMLVIGIKDWITTGKLSTETCLLLQGGIAAISVALSVLTGSWIPLAVGAVATLALAIVQNWGSISAWIAETWNAIANTVVSVFETIIAWCQAAHAWIQDVLTGLGLISDPTYTQADWDAHMPEEFRANGGFVDEGQLFIAREAGPELVGSMGGRTAVANNDQIVEGIRQGVYDAVVAANANGNSDVSVRVYLDSREIRAGQERLARAWG